MLCLSVCSLCISTPYEQMRSKFPGTLLSSRGRSWSTFGSENFTPSHSELRCWKFTLSDLSKTSVCVTLFSSMTIIYNENSF